eukprot:gene28918-35928_t
MSDGTEVSLLLSTLDEIYAAEDDHSYDQAGTVEDVADGGSEGSQEGDSDDEQAAPDLQLRSLPGCGLLDCWLPLAVLPSPRTADRPPLGGMLSLGGAPGSNDRQYPNHHRLVTPDGSIDHFVIPGAHYKKGARTLLSVRAMLALDFGSPDLLARTYTHLPTGRVYTILGTAIDYLWDE